MSDSRERQTSDVTLPGSPNSDSEGGSHRKFTINIDLCQHMQSGITELWESRRHTDVTFIISRNRVTAHRVILASQSEYFDRLLFGEMREAHTGAEIQLEDTPLQTFLLLLEYAYSGCLEIKDAELPDVVEIVRLADRFSFTVLKDALGDQLVERVSHTNVLQILVCADLYHLPRLQDHCLGFIDKNAAKVLESEALLSLPEDSFKSVISRDTFYIPEISIFQALVRWKESNGRSSEQMADILQCVRLSEIPPEQLFTVVEPSGLFDGNAILDAIRVQMKPELVQMQPRGKKEEGQNLLKSPTSVDPPLHTMTSSQFGVGHGLFGPPKAIIADITLNLTPSSDAPTQGTLMLGQNVGGLRRHGNRKSGSLKPSSVSTVTVTLDGLYLVNCLKLNAYPEATATGVQHPQKSFSYAINISRDDQRWVELFNYRNFSCLDTQDLHFPTQAVRSLRFELTGMSDASQQFPVKLASCSFTADQKPFMFLDHGIIAPLSPLTPLATQSMVKTSEDLPTCLMTFNQPYSISSLRFKICGSKSNKGDLMVSVSTKRKEESFKKIGDLENTEFGTHLTVEFQEQAVSYVMVAIKKMHGDGTATAPLDIDTKKIGLVEQVSEQNSTDTQERKPLSFVQPDKALMERFGLSAAGSWTCNVCFIVNTENTINCSVCGSTKGTTSTSAPTTFPPAQPNWVAISAGFKARATQTTQPSQLQPALNVVTSASRTPLSPSAGDLFATPSISRPTVPTGGIKKATAGQAPTFQSFSRSGPQVQPATPPPDLPCIPPLDAGATEMFTIVELTCQAGSQKSQQ